MTIQIPRGLDIHNLPNPYTRGEKFIKRGCDNYAYILNSILFRNVQRRLDYNTPQALSRDALRDVLGGNYKNYLQALIDKDIIETKNSYQALNGFGKAKRYALKGKVKLTTYTLTDKRLIDKIEQARIKRTQRIIAHNETARKVYETLKKINILPEAYTYVKERYHFINMFDYARKMLPLIGKEQLRNLISDISNTKCERKIITILNQYGITHKVRLDRDVDPHNVKVLARMYNKLRLRTFHIHTIKEISKGNHNLISMAEDKRTGRLFHNLTMLPKELRQFIRLDGEPLIELDGSNTQWQLLSTELNELCHIIDDITIKKNLDIDKSIIKKEIIDNIKSNKSSKNHSTTIALHPTSICGIIQISNNNRAISLHNELRYFNELLQKGTFRDVLGDKISLIKHVLFGNPSTPYNNNLNVVKRFKSVFPYIYQTIKLLKTEWLDYEHYGYTQKDRWKVLPLLLQEREASIFVRGMAQCNAEFITIHDAILTTRRNLPEVYKHLNNNKIKLNKLQDV